MTEQLIIGAVMGGLFSLGYIASRINDGVKALERIADAAERQAKSAERDTSLVSEIGGYINRCAYSLSDISAQGLRR